MRKSKKKSSKSKTAKTVMKVTEKTIKKDSRLQSFITKESARLLKHNVEESAPHTKAAGTETLMAKIFAFERNDATSDDKDSYDDLATV